ncbi:MAG: fumarylacetoacetate hydrolase family protein [Methanosphaera sp.]|nr:fumarylacetoacetate hydrolase family protein [Methanosphaera sp.]
MRFVRYNDSNDNESIGIIRDDSIVKIDYSSIYDAYEDFCQKNDLKELYVEDIRDIKFLTPTMPSKIICVGLNYKDHASELKMKLPDEPLLFMKSSTSMIAHHDEIIYPKISQQVDYEAELAIVLLEDMKYDEFNENVKFAYTIVNDVTARDLQQKDGQWTRAKNFDTFCPIGPCLVTDMDASNLDIKLEVNGKVRQNSNTSNMIFSPMELIEYVSSIMTLNKGDVIATGTPPGVGQLHKNDTVSITIEGIGTLENTVK